MYLLWSIVCETYDVTPVRDQDSQQMSRNVVGPTLHKLYSKVSEFHNKLLIVVQLNT